MSTNEHANYASIQIQQTELRVGYLKYNFDSAVRDKYGLIEVQVYVPRSPWDCLCISHCIFGIFLSSGS